MLELKKYDVDPLILGAPVSSPVISSNGKKIVFVRTLVDLEKDSYESHLWLVPTKGGEPKQITQCDGNDTAPLWSPDGETIYFTSNRSVNGETKNRLWSIHLKGGESGLVLEEGNILNPTFSSDGSKLLYLSRIEEDSETPSDKSDEVMWITKLRYKMDGQGYYPYTRPHVFVADLTTGKVIQVTKGPFDVSSPSWAPGSDKIAYVANPSNGDYSRMRDVYVQPLGAR
jgi:Tol biopolymer transport system component